MDYSRLSRRFVAALIFALIIVSSAIVMALVIMAFGDRSRVLASVGSFTNLTELILYIFFATYIIGRWFSASQRNSLGLPKWLYVSLVLGFFVYFPIRVISATNSLAGGLLIVGLVLGGAMILASVIMLFAKQPEQEDG